MKKYQGKNPYERLFRDVRGMPSHGAGKDVILSALEQLEPRDKWLLRHQYGLGAESLTVEELAINRGAGVTREHILKLLRRARKRLYELIRPPTEGERRSSRAAWEQMVIKKGLMTLALAEEEAVTAEEEEWLLRHHRIISRGISELRLRLNDHVAVARAAAATRG